MRSSQAVSHGKGKWISILETHYFSHQDCIPSIMKMTFSINWEFFFVDLQNEWLLIEQHYIIPLHCCKCQLAKLVLQSFSVRGGADKSLARQGRKQVTATKLGIYSTYSPWSSIHFLARCSNFCKPLKKKIQKVVLPTRSLQQQWPPRRTKNGELLIVFLSPGNR